MKHPFRRFSNRLWVLVFLLLGLVLPEMGVLAQEPAGPEEDKAQKVVTIKEPEDIYQIAVDDLTKTDAAKVFKEENYRKALEEFQFLAKLYPRDITIRRYIGLCYDRLGRYDDAIKAYNDALMLFPYHVPTHFYKALAFIRAGESQKGMNELKFVAGADPEGPYGQRARVIVTQVEAGRPIVPEKPKPWAFYGRLGWMYDSNVIVAPKQKTLRGANADLNASRYEIDGTLVYQLFQTSKSRSVFEYGFSESMNDDSLSEFNFHLQRWALSASFITDFLGRQWLNTIRHDTSVGWLDNNLFSVANTTSVSAATSFLKQTRTNVFTNFGYTAFGPDGSNPSFLSRDGLYGGWGINTTFFNKEGTQWITAGYNWNGAQTQGKDYDLTAHSVQVSLHTPLIEKFSADFSAAYQRGDYPNFDGRIFVETRGRRDDAWTLAIYLSRPITESITWRAFYRWFDTQNTNDIFAYRRDIAGTELNFQI